MTRSRDEKGRFSEEIGLEDILSTLNDAETPVMTASQIAEKLGCSGESARQKLHILEREGKVEKMQVGARAIVWWPT